MRQLMDEKVTTQVYKVIDYSVKAKNYNSTDIKDTVLIEISTDNPDLSKIDPYSIYHCLFLLSAHRALHFVSKLEVSKLYKVKIYVNRFKVIFSRYEDSLQNPLSSSNQSLSKGEDKIHMYKDLIIDLNRCIMQYEGHRINISPDNNPIKFLILLIEKAEFLVEYVEIAKRLGLNSYQEEDKNKDVAREIQYLKRDLGKELRKEKLSESAVNKLKDMIIFKKNLGYMLKKNN